MAVCAQRNTGGMSGLCHRKTITNIRPTPVFRTTKSIAAAVRHVNAASLVADSPASANPADQLVVEIRAEDFDTFLEVRILAWPLDSRGTAVQCVAPAPRALCPWCPGNKLTVGITSSCATLINVLFLRLQFIACCLLSRALHCRRRGLLQ